MYKKLHRRLTLLFTALSGAVMIVLSAGYLFTSEKELAENSRLTFSSKAASFLSNLEWQDSLNWEWLFKNAAGQGFLLALYDNGIPVSYTREVLSDSERALAEAAKTYAGRAFPDLYNGPGPLALHREFFWKDPNRDGKQETYYGSFFCIPKNDGKLTGILLSSLAPLNRQILGQRLRIFLMNLAGLALLLAVTRFFIGKLLKPVVEARKKQAAFTAAASHELRTPVAVIRSAVSAAKAAGSDGQEHFFQIIEDETLRLSSLTDDLLLLNRSDSGRLSLSLHLRELDTLLLNTFESFEPLAKEREIKLKIQLPDEALAPCRCDGERIRQVLGILISNALSYGAPNGYVKLSLSYNRSFFQIGVEDNGPGIANEDKARIFDRFYRADASRSEKDHFGLGLSIAKEIIDAHGGKILVTDTPGGGTRFFVLLK